MYSTTYSMQALVVVALASVVWFPASRSWRKIGNPITFDGAYVRM